ncbi:ArsR/SmtB family transcription factor [Streptomyces sp. NPDC048594]|uniref:ArsR/SmtB family transcription factor n=1 Tax=Streptomyces sp. NPDC048594 TaxID=3365575 RepID=UPI00370FA5CC
MLRIHFTGQDLENIRLARGPDPLWEIVCSVCRLQTREGALAFDPWRRQARARLLRDGTARRAALALRGLVPFGAYFPDFLTPPVEGHHVTLRDGVERVLATPRARLRHELALLASSGARPVPGAAALARGEVTALGGLGSGLHVYDEALLGPVRDRIGAAVGADLAWRTRALVTGGTAALLATFRPVAAWRPPVLEVDYPVRRDLHLEGRGLLLVPSYFCWRRPITLVDADQNPVLVYPADKTVVPAPVTGSAALTALVGPTRAALLHEAAGRACGTTSELAAAVGISLPSGSQQLAVLREAGLLTTRRAGKYVLHSVTALGLRLLGDDLAGPEQWCANGTRARNLPVQETATEGIP